MAIAEFYEVPEINPETATDTVFGSCLSGRASMEKATWVGEQLVDLTGSRPEELPPCFLAVQAEALSPRTGWRTEHGLWEPKELFISPSIFAYAQDLLKSTIPPTPVMCVRTKLVFRPNDGSKSDLAMTMYNLATVTTSGALLEEDIALCHVFRVPKDKGKGKANCERGKSRFGRADVHVDKDKGKGNFSCSFGSAVVPVMEDDDSYKSLIPDVDGLFDNNYKAYVGYNPYVNYALAGGCDLPPPDSFDGNGMGICGVPPPDSFDGNGVGSCDLPSIDSLGGPKKRPRSRSAGVSDMWGSFTRIYTKDPKVVYAACHRCCKMMKLTGGSKCGTTSLSSHLASVSCKSGSSVDTFSLIRGHGGIVITGSLV